MDKLFKHLKLEKFISGQEQRIFKTTTNISQVKNDHVINQKQGKSQNVYYGNLKDIPSNEKYLSSNLIDFHQINYDYVYHKPDNIKVTTIYNDKNNPYFTQQANIIKNYTDEQDGQIISYFPEYMYTPIDMCKLNNSYFLLLPISTNRFINIPHPNNTFQVFNSLKNLGFGSFINSNLNDIPFKPNYTNMLSAFYNKSSITTQDNNIPVYDMFLNNIQTIKFESSQEVFQWILRWNLENIVYKKDEEYVSLLNEILYDSTNECFYNDQEPETLDNYDSIVLKPLIDYILSKPYLYSKDTVIKMITELVSVIDLGSIVRFLNPVGYINTINSQFIENKNSNLYDDLQRKNIYNIKDLLTQKQTVSFHQDILPQNTLIIGNSLYPLYKNSQDVTADYFPSCYVNFIHLKNNHDPEYQIEYSLNDDFTSNNLNYSIDSQGYISTNIIDDSLYDMDGRFSIEYNNGSISNIDNLTLTKNTTQNIIDGAIEKDNSKASGDTGYVTNYPQRMSLKEMFYINQYNDKNITQNKSYNAGTLNGFRNYLNTGVTFNEQNWLAYRYNCIKTNTVNFYQEFELPFLEYSLHREQNWVTDINGNNLTKYTMKYAGFECPWSETIQNDIIGCSLNRDKVCTNFCTYPCQGRMRSKSNTIMGITWNCDDYITDQELNINTQTIIKNSLSKEFFIINSEDYDRNLYAGTDISITDDIQIFFIKNLNNLNYKSILNSITEQMEFKAIFNGFGKSSATPQSGIIYPEFIYKNQIDTSSIEYPIAENSNFNGPHIITKNTQLYGYNTTTNQVTNILPKGYSCLIKIKSWWSDTVECTGTIATKIAESSSSDITSNILSCLTNYQFIQTIDGFYKFKQTGLHKSNIYSINLSNTGLNPDNDKQLQYYTKDEIAKIIQQKYNIKYYAEDDNFLIANEQNLFIASHYNSYLNSNKFCKTPLFKNLYEKYQVSNLENLSGFILWLETMAFDEFISIQNLATTQDQDTKETLYYYLDQYLKIYDYNKVRQNLRELIEKAIKDSIIKYMPADTTLWKIKYSGD